VPRSQQQIDVTRSIAELTATPPAKDIAVQRVVSFQKDIAPTNSTTTMSPATQPMMAMASSPPTGAAEPSRRSKRNLEVTQAQEESPGLTSRTTNKKARTVNGGQSASPAPRTSLQSVTIIRSAVKAAAPPLSPLTAAAAPAAAGTPTAAGRPATAATAPVALMRSSSVANSSPQSFELPANESPSRLSVANTPSRTTHAGSPAAANGQPGTGPKVPVVKQEPGAPTTPMAHAASPPPIPRYTVMDDNAKETLRSLEERRYAINRETTGLNEEFVGANDQYYEARNEKIRRFREEQLKRDEEFQAEQSRRRKEQSRAKQELSKVEEDFWEEHRRLQEELRKLEEGFREERRKRQEELRKSEQEEIQRAEDFRAEFTQREEEFWRPMEEEDTLKRRELQEQEISRRKKLTEAHADFDRDLARFFGESLERTDKARAALAAGWGKERKAWEKEKEAIEQAWREERREIEAMKKAWDKDKEDWGKVRKSWGESWSNTNQEWEHEKAKLQEELQAKSGQLDVLTKKIEDLENEVTSEKNKAGELRDLLEEAEAIKEMRRKWEEEERSRKESLFQRLNPGKKD
jgi:hypothetical protein